MTMRMRMEIVSDLTMLAAERVDAAAAAAVAEGAARIRDDARHRVEAPPKTGRIYTSKTKPSPHQASAPGEAPANWTGNLMENITSHMVASHEAVVEVEAAADYGYKYLEFGSDGGKIAPRPFFTPAVEEGAPVFEELLGRAVGEALAGA